LRFNIRILIIAVIGTFLAVLWQEINLSYLRESYPGRIENGFIRTADDASYIQPPLNWKKSGIWTDGSTGKSSFVQRPPGYGMVFLLASYIAPSNPYWTLKIIHILCYFLSIVLIAKILSLSRLNERLTLVATTFFAVLPLFNGFIYHTLSESISPVLLLWSVYESFKLHRNEGGYWWWILSNGFLILVRPQLILFPLVFVAFMMFKKRWKQVVYGTLIFLPFLLWQVRTVTIMGKPSLHPIYSDTNHSQYRSSHEALGELFRIWEYRSDQFHETLEYIYGDTSSVALERAVANLPDTYREEVRPILKEYQELSVVQLSHFKEGTVNHQLPEEKNFIKNTEKVQEMIASENKLTNWVITPFYSAMELCLNSHLHLTIFQEKFRGNFIMETARWLSVIVVLSSLFALMFALVWYKSIDRALVVSFVASVLTIAYLVFIQRLNEERYLTPILPMGYIALWLVVNKVLLLIRPGQTRQ
jgi:hypothetical protein